MKLRPILLAAATIGGTAILLALASSRSDAQTATQTVTFQVTGVNRIAVSGNPATLAINTAEAGSDLGTASDASTTYSITTNQSNQKITGQITAGTIPTGVTLKAELAGSPGTSSGAQTLSAASAVDLVTAISQSKATGKTITYSLSATLAAAVMGSSSNVTVTYTVTAGS